MPMFSSRPMRFTLRDGGQVLVRPVEPQDKEHVIDGLARLSERSRYRRFLAPVRQLSEEQLRYLTEIDQVDHMAWAAVDAEDLELGLGIARYVRVEGEPSAAEAAVTVIDSHHGRGVGLLLLSALSRSAVANGITTFRGYVLEDNEPMTRILRDLGATTQREEGGLLRVEVPLPTNPDQLADTPISRVFKAVAREMVPPFAVRFLHADFFSSVLRGFARRHERRDRSEEEKTPD